MHPPAWTDEGVRQAGALLCDLHDATAGVPAATRRGLAALVERHVVARDGLPVGLVGRMIGFAIRDCAAEAAYAGITTESTDPGRLWELSRR